MNFAILPLAVLLAASLAGKPSMPNTGSPCGDACALLRKSCDDTCTKKDRHPARKGQGTGDPDRSQGDDQDDGDPLPVDPKACLKECDTQVRGCKASCPSMVRQMEERDGKAATNPKR